jgi:hypothetical protein
MIRSNEKGCFGSPFSWLREDLSDEATRDAAG